MANQTETKTFFNVMPEATSGPLSKPKIQTTITSESEVAAVPKKGLSGAIPASFRNMKSMLILGAAGLILIIALAAGLYFYFSSDEPTQKIPENNTPAPTQPETNPDVTTPPDFLLESFGSETCIELVICGDKSDPDRDGLDNKAEYEAGTDPNLNDSDNDGIADGDEALIFGSDPLLLRTYQDGQYSDADFIKGGYDISTNAPYTNEAMLTVKSKVKQYGLHQPTLTTLGGLSFQLYEFTDPSLPPLPADLDLSPQAKLDRDSLRQSTIKKIGAALLKYKEDKKAYPPTDEFIVMADMIRPYNTVATNYNDPIAIEPYVYGYQATNNNTDFTLSYYSETQNQLIKYFAKDAEADSAKDDTKQYDEARKLDLENIRQALLVWSSVQLDPASEKEFVFPPADQLKTSLVPRYLLELPTDPITGLDYLYTVNETFENFAILSPLQNPPSGMTGYMCDRTECKNY